MVNSPYQKNVAIIPARSGSKGIPNKNIKVFCGKPLIAYTVDHARKAGIFDRIIVDTDSEKIARVAKKYGAEVPFLRPAELASDTAQVSDAVILLLDRLAKEENYHPDLITLLQTTSPLREVSDIKECYKAIQNKKIKSVCTISESHPRFYNLAEDQKLILVNRPKELSSNRQAWPKGYILNGCIVYIIRTSHFLKTQKFVDEDTYGVITPRWRAIDLDYPEDWILAEAIYKNKKLINAKLKKA